jgi:hypothetical protein
MSGARIRTIPAQALLSLAWRDETLVALRPLIGSNKTLGMVLAETEVHTGTQRAYMLQSLPEPDSSSIRGAKAASYDPTGNGAIFGGVLSPDGKRAAVWNHRLLWLLDTRTHRALAQWEQNCPVAPQDMEPGSEPIAFSPDASTLAWLSASCDNGICLADATTGRTRIPR